MAMTKAQILAALAVVYPKGVDVPGGNPQLVEEVGFVKKYLYHHLETGLDQDGSQVARKAFKPFYVWKEGDAGEDAYFDDTAASNSVDKSTVGGKLQTIASLYSSTLLKSRVRGALVKSCFTIAEEAGTVPNHAARIKFAFRAMQEIETYLGPIMCSLCSKGSIKDGTATDAQVQNFVDGCIDTWAVLV